MIVEALESIARSADVAKEFYGKEQTPIFEVALPMTTSHLQLLRVSSFYEKIVVGKQDIMVHPEIENFSIKNWLGKVMPQEIGIIPLVEDKTYQLIFEPGRFIAGNSGIFVTEVIYVKKTGAKNFAIVIRLPATAIGTLMRVSGSKK